MVKLLINLYWLGAIYVFGITIIMGFSLPHTLKIFREAKKFNKALIIFTTLFLIGFVIQTFPGFNCLERKNLFYPLYGITYLIFYKISDNYIINTKGRHMYYLTIRHIKDEESKKSTSLENIIQIFNLIASLALSNYVSFLLVKLIYNCQKY